MLIHHVLLGLGANLASHAGPPEATLGAALIAIAEVAGPVVACSSLYRSPAWPDPADPAYVNLVAVIATGEAPAALLPILRSVESAFGRKPSPRNAPRPLDIDIIDHGGLVMDTPTLVLPHPRLKNRAFVLVPLAEIMPAWRHPGTGEKVGDLLASLPVGDVQKTVLIGPRPILGKSS